MTGVGEDGMSEGKPEGDQPAGGAHWSPPYPAQYPGPSPEQPAGRPPTAYPQPHRWPPPQSGQGHPGRPGQPSSHQPWPAYPHPEPTQYHRMFRTWNYAWWRPVVGTLVLFVAFFVVAPLALLPIVLIGASGGEGAYLDNLMDALSFEQVTPTLLLYLNLTLGSMILVTWAITRVLHNLRPRWLSSVVPRLRWKFLLVCVGLSVVALVAQVLVGLVIPGQTEADLSRPVNDFTRTTAVLAVIVLLTTPLQAAGEEYMFRGYLTQAVGSLFRNKWVAIVVPALLFAVVHGAQNFPLFFDRLMFGLIAGWLVIRTGGLEAAIALHILNNFLAFGFALTFGDLTESLMVSEVGWANIPLTLTQAGIYALVVTLVASKMRLQTHTRQPAESAVAATSEPAAAD